MKESMVRGRFYDVVTVGERGQIVIPAKARKDFKIKPGDQMLVVRGLGHGAIVLVNTQNLSHMLNHMVKSFGKIRKLISK